MYAHLYISSCFKEGREQCPFFANEGLEETEQMFKVIESQLLRIHVNSIWQQNLELISKGEWRLRIFSYLSDGVVNDNVIKKLH